MEAQEWNIRPATGEDLNFIYDTWLQNYKHSSSLGKSMRSGVFFKEYRYVIDHILSNSKTIVTCDKSNTNIIFSYLVYNDEALHYCFTKEAFRRMGMAESLFKEATKDWIQPIPISHKTKMLDYLDHNYKLEFNPFILYTHKETQHGNEQKQES